MMENEEAYEAFVEAVLEHLPLFFSVDAASARDRLNQAGYRMARQLSGEPMVAKQVGDAAVCLFAKPSMPLPKAKLVGSGAGRLFDRFTATLETRGFQRAASGNPKPGMRIETYSALEPGRIFAITVMQMIGNDQVLLAAAMPPADVEKRSVGIDLLASALGRKQTLAPG